MQVDGEKFSGDTGIVDMGIGQGVDPSTVSKEELKKCIIEVAGNNK